jgi:ABC-2 type transport system ATP-binding protein
MSALELDALAGRKVQTLSGGQRRRLDVALGLVHRPGLLFLDEPSTGLDPQSRANLWEHVLRLRAEHGMTVFLTTHYLDEADTMAERVMVMDHGRVIADDTADRLKSKHVGERIVVRAAGRDGAARLAAAVGDRGVRRRGRRPHADRPGRKRPGHAAGPAARGAGRRGGDRRGPPAPPSTTSSSP